MTEYQERRVGSAEKADIVLGFVPRTKAAEWSIHMKEQSGKKRKEQSSCDTCVNYVYDEDYECYCCEMNLDEDEMARFLADSFRDCPYYQLDNEYLVVRHQM